MNPESTSKPIIFKSDLTPERLNQHLSACRAFDAGGFLAADCEMMGLKPARDRLCLVQLCDEHNNVSLVQIQPDQSSAPNLKVLFEHCKVTKVFHFGRADLSFLKYQLDISVNPLYCTKIASKLARTYTERHGLRELARELLGLDLNKGQQSSDWGRQDFSPEQIEYAAGDVTHLLQIRQILDQILRREGRDGLAERCFAMVPLLVDLDLLEYSFLFEHQPPKVP